MDTAGGTRGITSPGDVGVRGFRVEDAEAVTELVHRAYAELDAMGLNFTAVDQPVEVTLRRALSGHCLVLERDGVVVGTVTISLPPSQEMQGRVAAARVPGRAWLSQLAVDPDCQGSGLAGRLWRAGRDWAQARGATSIALDTAVPAEHLVSRYRHWGFREAEVVHFPGKTYDSVVMVCPLARPPEQPEADTAG